jgi:large subunit ribosomal protein L27
MNGRDSNSKRLGVKIYGGEPVISGNIIVRQKGSTFFAAQGVSRGKDFTLFATQDGVVKFTEKRVKKFDGRVFRNIFVSVISHVEEKTVKVATPKKVASTAKKVAAPKKVATKTTKSTKEDLTIIEGIGPKVAGIFQEAGITTFAQLADMSAEAMKALLVPHGSPYSAMDTTTWAEQSALARDGKMEELEVLKKELDGGKRV